MHCVLFVNGATHGANAVCMNAIFSEIRTVIMYIKVRISKCLTSADLYQAANNAVMHMYLQRS